MLIKKSITLKKHRTSLSLEIEFWEALSKIAEKKNLSIERLISEISSICPVWVGGQGTMTSKYFTNQKYIKAVDDLNHLESLLTDLASGN